MKAALFVVAIIFQATSLMAGQTSPAAGIPVTDTGIAGAGPAQSAAAVPVRSVKFLYGKKDRGDKANCVMMNQSGTTIDNWGCSTFTGLWRCYADILVDGKALRVNGECASSLVDCWSGGSSAVSDPCEEMEDPTEGDSDEEGQTPWWGQVPPIDTGCRVINQSGTVDYWGCSVSPGKWRCYADIEVAGKPFRVNGSCAESLGDCWSSGSGAVKDPCGYVTPR